MYASQALPLVVIVPCCCFNEKHTWGEDFTLSCPFQWNPGTIRKITLALMMSPIYRTCSFMEQALSGEMRCFISWQMPIATQPHFALYPTRIFSFTYTNDCVITMQLERHSKTKLDGAFPSFLIHTIHGCHVAYYS